MITDERAEEAFTYLRDTVADIGMTKAELERSEILRKRARKRIFVGCEGSVAMRDALAETHDDVAAADERYVKAVQEHETLRAHRDIETIALDVWRTESANRRKA